MSRINRADWTKERIAAFRKFLAGDREASYRGRKKNGEMYKKTLKVSKLIEYYKGFSIGKGAKLMVSGEVSAAAIVRASDMAASVATSHRSPPTEVCVEDDDGERCEVPRDGQRLLP